MTPEELRELAGLNGPSKVEVDKKWSDAQLNKNQDDIAGILNRTMVQPPTPMEKLEQRLNNEQPHEIDNVAARLNSLMRTPGKPKEVKVEPKLEPVENIAVRLNATLGMSGIKIERIR